MERATGIEPATSTLARWRATNCAKPASAGINIRDSPTLRKGEFFPTPLYTGSPRLGLGAALVPGPRMCRPRRRPAWPFFSPRERPCCRMAKRAPRRVPFTSVGGETRIRTGDKGFAGLCLTTWPSRQRYEKGRYETGPIKSWSGLRGSNPRPPPWQGGALPTALSPRRKKVLWGKVPHNASSFLKFSDLVRKTQVRIGANPRWVNRRQVDSGKLLRASSRMRRV